MPRYDTVLLDADNTLFDFDAAEHAALRRALEERGYPFTPETEALYLDINRPLWAAFDRGEVTQDFLVVERFRLLVERLGGSDDPVSFNRDYLTYLGEGNQLLPGAEDLCRDLRAAGCRLALATNGVARVQHARLDASPLKPYFSAVIISQEVGAQKPQPAFFQAALEALGVLDKARCVMVGTRWALTSRAASPPGWTPSGMILWAGPPGTCAPPISLPPFRKCASIL